MTNKRRLAILGASGHGKVCADIAEQLDYRVEFFDDRSQTLGTRIELWPLVGDTQTLIDRVDDFDAVFIAVGNNQARRKLYKRFSELDIELASLISPAAVVSSYASVAEGVVVMPNAVINAYAKVGMGAIVNTAAVVEHDCVIQACAHISPNAALAGGVALGECAWLGIGACAKQLINIGNNSVVGAGAVVVKDVADNLIVVGNPAQVK
ncbi:MAG: acetyltransferase [Agarilytica sp.]